jgi:hypothetical protein
MLGAIGLVLFVIPIASIPICTIGIVVGVAGIVAARLGSGQISLRLCVAGILLCLCGLAISSAIARGPEGYFTPRSVFPTVQPATNRPYVPPPADP